MGNAHEIPGCCPGNKSPNDQDILQPGPERINRKQFKKQQKADENDDDIKSSTSNEGPALSTMNDGDIENVPHLNFNFKPSEPDYTKLEEYKNSPFYEERPTV
jgi:hypothetical protein